MGLSTKSTIITRKAAGLDRSGVALPAALFALVVVGVLGTGIWAMTDVTAAASKNREAGARALALAEAGAAHALGVIRDTLRDTTFTRLLRGNDNTANTADDGYLTGLGMSGSLVIPSTGSSFGDGSYYVQIIDDPADGDGDPKRDSNRRVLARCTGVTSRGATASIDVVIGAPYAGIASDGDLKISGNPELLGSCGGGHANLDLEISGTITTQTGLSATGGLIGSGSAVDPDGDALPILTNQPPVDIPDYNPLDYCGPADFILQANGFVYEVATSTQHDARSTEKFGWKRSSSSPVLWDLSGNSGVPGTVCAYGNVKVSGNPGSSSVPLPLSILATGSVEVSGNPFIVPAHPEGIAIMAAGDVAISGNPTVSTANWEGFIYSGSQCKINGDPRVLGTVLCGDNPDPLGSIDITPLNEVSGNPEIIASCSGFNRKRPLSWFQALGS